MTALPRALILLMLVMMISCSRGHAVDPLPGFPKLVLWAWERPENLSYIAPGSTGVAFLAATLTVNHDRIAYQPRMQPLWIPDHTPLIAVFRIESLHSNSLEGMVGRVVSTVRGVPIRAVQIDFDARFSERQSYTDFMQALRRSLPSSIALEMTALVSWCQKDDWIGNLPVVDAVPMFFRMGADPHPTTERLREQRCSASIGISTDELPDSMPSGKRVFVFNAKPWTQDSYRAILQMVKP